MKIFVDLDGVLWDTISTIVALYDEDFRLYPNYKKVDSDTINTWDFDELQLATRDIINRYFSSARFFSNVTCNKSARFFIEKMIGCGNKLCFCSIGSSANLLGKRLWLADNVFQFFPGDMEFYGINEQDYKDKSMIDMTGSLFIDDSVNNLNSSNAKYKICFGKPLSWNKDWEGIRCETWMDVIDWIAKNIPTEEEE